MLILNPLFEKEWQNQNLYITITNNYLYFQKVFIEVSKIILPLLIAIFLLLTLLLHYRRESTEIYEKAHIEAQYISVAMPRDCANYLYTSVKPNNPYNKNESLVKSTMTTHPHYPKNKKIRSVIKFSIDPGGLLWQLCSQNTISKKP